MKLLTYILKALYKTPQIIAEGAFFLFLFIVVFIIELIDEE